jgi:Ca-activated chloride channel family protein
MSPQASSGVVLKGGHLSVRVSLVLVPVTVTDGMNRPVTGLQKDNFSVFEDERPQTIRYFAEQDTPISVGIILDVSGTMSNKIDAAREALGAFFDNSHPDDDFFVITFSDNPQLTMDYTQRSADIQGKLVTVKPYGYTALLDAVHMGLNKLRTARHERRALLIISDGGDNASRHKIHDVKSEIEESGVEVYAMGLFDEGLPIVRSLDEKIGKHMLSQITEASGGRTLTVSNLAKLPEIARQISIEMRDQYLLGYLPATSTHDATWRKIKVKVNKPSSRLHPTYKKGYAPSQD